ncbi:MAG: intradiol ring-cleavage dioxygenase [Roseiflexaceae bacterium]|nr:intradiol ring-cleavage dioxygenase [Roseiflexaceae bacterium]
MDNDDAMIGRILSRREVIKLLGAAGATLLAGCAPATSTTSTVPTSAAAPTPALNAEAASAAALDSPTAQATAAAELATAEAANTAVASSEAAVPACVVRPEVTEGPYYVDVDLLRSDIRADATSGEVRAGAPLVVTFSVAQVNDGSCGPLAGATVEIWHCDAVGAYSGVSDRSFDTQGQTWLRGAQVTDANGIATFTTIYPGWYQGRAIHIHFKVSPSENQVFTSQLFFDETLSDQVFAQAPYAGRGQRNTLNSNDNIYDDLLLLTTTQTADGYAATFPIGIDLSTIGSGQGGGPGGPAPRS